MVLTVQEAYRYMDHALGGSGPPVEFSRQRLLNRAMDQMYAMHPWRWQVERTALLNTRGLITITDGTWTAATLTLTSTGAFTDYTFVVGDQLEIESGTGATTGFYEIASRTDDDSIVLKTTISSSDLATGDINVRIELATVDLPTDFRDMITITATDSLLYGVRMTTLEQIIQNRTSQIEVTTSWNYQGAIVYSGSPPVPILEIWPTPSASSNGVFTLVYRRKWVRATGDNATVDVPEFMEPLAIEMIQHYVTGIVRRDDATVDRRMLEIEAGPTFAWAKRQDGMVQPNYGRMRGGGAQHHSRHFGASRYCYLTNTVNAPA